MKRIGAQTCGRTLFFGGLLFGLFGVATILGVDRYLPVDVGCVLIGLFMLNIAIPAFVFSWREVAAAREIRKVDSSARAVTPWAPVNSDSDSFPANHHLDDGVALSQLGGPLREVGAPFAEGLPDWRGLHNARAKSRHEGRAFH